MDFFLGEIRAVGFSIVPRGWAPCNGQMMPIPQNQALFALLGTAFGGNGINTFGLPDLRGRAMTGQGSGPAGQATLGMISGSTTATLNVTNLPPHTHLAVVSNAAATLTVPDNGFWGIEQDGNGQPLKGYSPATGTLAPMDPRALGNTGSGQPVNIMQPTMVINFLISLQGIFPSRN